MLVTKSIDWWLSSVSISNRSMGVLISDWALNNGPYEIKKSSLSKVSSTVGLARNP